MFITDCRLCLSLEFELVRCRRQRNSLNNFYIHTYVENIQNLAHAALEATSAEQHKFEWTKQLPDEQEDNQMKSQR